jgi:NADPH:quinone reductase-like Zn-dependent oxidoreductase
MRGGQERRIFTDERAEQLPGIARQVRSNTVGSISRLSKRRAVDGNAGTLHIQIGRTFRLEEIVEAHRCMEENKAGGKIVVLT